MNTELVSNFLQLNPNVSNHLRIDDGKEYGTRVNSCGFYRLGRIVIFESRCTKPGHGYSWPGHISDRTTLGVLAHELGHHVHLSKSTVEADWIRRNLPVKGERITSYEPNVDESFAETFRLFVLNPTLLEEGRPNRFAFMRSLDLISPEFRTWKEVLKDIPPRMIARIPNWIGR